VTRQLVGPQTAIHTPSSGRVVIMSVHALKHLCIERAKQVGGIGCVHPKLDRPNTV
jgi:hypothetical protein